MEPPLTTIYDAPPAPEAIVRQSWVGELVVSLGRWWSVFQAWRFERAAINQLSSLSDRQLKDIGLDRSEIMGAVRNQVTRGHTPSRYYRVISH
jgi:uncharacterized protein YjiS (DUF1127 family)